MAKAYGIQFYSDRFDQTSELPKTINAGNRFYGSDLANYIKNRLSLTAFEVIDEDWGWLVTGNMDGMRVDYGISDWHEINEQFGGTPDGIPKNKANWCIIISTYRTSRFLGVVPYSKQVDCPEHIGQSLTSILTSEGDEIVESGIE